MNSIQKLSFMTFTCPDWGLSRIIRAAKDYGYKGVEIRVTSGRKHNIELQTPLEERKRAEAFFEENGLEISCLSTSIKLFSPSEEKKNMELLKGYLQLASDIGTKYLRIFGGPISKAVKREDYLNHIAENLKKAVKNAREYNRVILVETHDDLSLGKDMVNLLEKVNSSGLGVVWDIMHPYFHGEDIEETFRYLKPYIRHVHVHDAIKTKEYGKLVNIGEGVIPIKEAIELLKSINFDGYLSFEYWPDMGNPEIMLPDYAERLRKFL